MKAVNPYVNKIKEFSENIWEKEERESAADFYNRVQCLIESNKNIVVEIGSGSGNHIVTLASTNTDSTFIGFELRYKRAFRTIEKARGRKLNNVFVVRHDARDISSFFKRTQIEEFYINFPDPWEKRRRRKNRTLGKDFLDTCSVLLKPGGTISFKTDHTEYFETFLSDVRCDARFRIEAKTSDLYKSEYVQFNIPTEFEEMFSRESIAICYSKIKMV